MQAELPLRQDRPVMLALLIHVMATRHRGQARGIKALHLAAETGLAERSLRRLISEARNEGVPIGGTPETGYYVAQTATELEDCCRFLRARAMHSLHLEARLRKISLPQLLGQINLET